MSAQQPSSPPSGARRWPSLFADALAILQDLVAIPSENPGGSEVAIADYCRDLLVAAKIDVETVGSRTDRPNLVARLEGRGNAKLVYQGHLDTKPAYHAGTPADAWTRPPFKATIEGDRLYGLGACDTKGGVAAQLAAFVRLSRDWSTDMPTLEWQGVADEENGSLFGCAHLAGLGRLGADLAIVAEPTQGQLSFDQMGSVWSRVQVSGRQAHGGMPWLGADAIAGGLVLISRVAEAVAARKADPADFHPSLGVRVLNGGSHAGTVAGELTIVADIRVPPGRARREFRTIWRAEAARVERELGLTVRIEPYLDGGCAPNSLASPGLRNALAAAWEAAVGDPCRPHRFMGGSDARFFTAVETPTAVLGPGSLAQAHAADEFVSLAELERCAAFFASCPRTLRFPSKDGAER